MEFLKSLVTWWNSQTLNTRLHTWKNGVKVGEDEQGNVYYTTRDEKRRWVIFNKDWEKPHQENLTGTISAYVPDGSLKSIEPKKRTDYEAWQPE